MTVGVRAAESASRAKRAIYETYGAKHIFRPIFDWKTNDVWDYIHEHEMSYCCLYDQGKDRIGCILCPLMCIRKRHADYLQYPKHVAAIERAVGRYLEIHPDGYLKWLGNTPSEIVHMWIAETPGTDADGQCTLGEELE